jgi:holo-[acyl-carrier protein] synthase
MVKSVGLDAIEIERIGEAIGRHGERFLARVYTPAERRLAAESGESANQFFAGRFGAKEAVLKALGTGYAQGLAFHEVEVLRNPSGAPRLVLHGAARARADELGVAKVHVSITHTKSDAYAVAVAE